MQDPIKSKIIELVPDIARTVALTQVVNGKKKVVEEVDLVEDITLAVVLRAILKMQPANKTLITLECDGQFLTHDFSRSSVAMLGPTWNLAKDNFDGQTPECQAFIGSLLDVTK